MDTAVELLKQEDEVLQKHGMQAHSQGVDGCIMILKGMNGGLKEGSMDRRKANIIFPTTLKADITQKSTLNSNLQHQRLF